ALVLVPNIHHPVQFLFACLDIEITEQLIPIGTESCKGIIYLLNAIKTRDCLFGLFFVYDTQTLPLLFLLVLNITQKKDQLLSFTRFQLNLEVVRRNGGPAMSHTIARLSLQHRLRFIKTVVKSKE